MSDRIVSKEDIRAHAVGPLFDQSEFEEWFASPQAALSGARPADLVDAGRGGEILLLIGASDQKPITNRSMP